MSQKGSLTEQEKQHRKGLFGSIKNKSLLRLAVLYYTFFYGSPTGPREAVKQRLWAKGIPLYNNHIAFELKPSDVAPIIHCSERAAQEYVDLLKLLMMY
jgi:hypothetical protein